ncbi:MAG: triose-phosphate isomerase [Acetobacteraceae bacterium]
MRRPLIAANWKMHGRLDMLNRYLAGLGDDGPGGDVEVVLCPPTSYLAPLAAGLAALDAIALGAQDCSPEKEDGAFTGDVSAAMLADLGCRWVIVGHSERRERHGESDAVVAAKFAAAQAAGLAPVLCVGESRSQRDAGEAEAVVSAQVEAVVKDRGVATFARAAIAYEPVWAIGTGCAATPEVAESMHALVRETVAGHDRAVAGALRILYGGSAKPENAAAFFAEPDIDGALIGGASLDPESLLAIVAAARARSTVN